MENKNIDRIDSLDAILNKAMVRPQDISSIMHISTSSAYKIIHKLNEELKAKGYLTFKGRCPTEYFIERCIYQSIKKDN